MFEPASCLSGLDEVQLRAATYPAGPGGQAGERIQGGTFHAVAHKIIREHAEAFCLPPEFTVLDLGDVTDVFDALRAGYGLAGAERRAPRAAACADIYSRCVNTQRPVAEVVRAGFPWCAEFTGQLAEMFRGYGARKRGHALVDFGGPAGPASSRTHGCRRRNRRGPAPGAADPPCS